MKLSLIPLSLGAALAVGASVPAQYSCSPWSKNGLQCLPWQAGSTLELGTIQSGARSIALRFEHHADAGLVLSSIGHRGTRKDGTVALWEYQSNPPTGEAPALWKAVFRPVDDDTPVELFPDADDVFEIWVDAPTETRTAVFRWTDIDVDPLCDSRFWAELRVCIDPADPARAVWWSRMGRIQRPGCDGRWTLDEVHAPIVFARQPAFGLDARLLVPTYSSESLLAPNLSMRAWQLFGLDTEFQLEHPARGQQMQFSAMFSNDATELPLGGDVVSSFRKLLYMSTEDTSGYYKKFAHRVAVDTMDPAFPLYYRWTPIYFPTYGPTPFRNIHRAEYPAVLEALEAQTDSYWFDVTERYRRFVEDCVRPPKLTSWRNYTNPDFPQASVFQPSSTVEDTTDFIGDVFSASTDHALLLQQAFVGADGQPTPMFMEWQKWLKGDPNDSPFARIPEDPIGPDFNPRPYSGASEAFQEIPQSAIDQIARARGEGINASVYTLPVIMNDQDWPSFRDEWFLRQRDGSFIPVAENATGWPVDHGNFFVAPWFVHNLYSDILGAAPDMGGFFLDVLAGTGSRLRYPSDPRFLFRPRQYHGGRAFSRGVGRLIDLLRLRIALSKPRRARHPDIPFLASEGVQEFLVGKLDFGQQGLKSMPMQQQFDVFNEQFLEVVGLLPPGTAAAISREVSNPHPPLWNAVYHEYQSVQGLTVPLNFHAVSEVLGGGAFPGISFDQWADYQRFCAALFWFQGMKPTIFPYYNGLSADPYNLLVEGENGSGPRLSDPTNPAQRSVLDFHLRLHGSLDRGCEAGRFLTTGRLERPLQTPGTTDPARISRLPNPATAVAAGTAASPFFLVQHFYENAFSLGAYEVPGVFHMVWSDSDTGELAVVFVNWTRFPAAWEGVIDPSCYSQLGETFELVGLRPVGTGVEEYLIGQASGPTTVAWNPTTSGVALRHHDAATPFFMPPESIQVVLLRSVGD